MSEMQDIIHNADKMIHADDHALKCNEATRKAHGYTMPPGKKRDEDHGKMFPHVSGSGLICGICAFQAAMPQAIA